MTQPRGTGMDKFRKYGMWLCILTAVEQCFFIQAESFGLWTAPFWFRALNLFLSCLMIVWAIVVGWDNHRRIGRDLNDHANPRP